MRGRRPRAMILMLFTMLKTTKTTTTTTTRRAGCVAKGVKLYDLQWPLGLQDLHASGSTHTCACVCVCVCYECDCTDSRCVIATPSTIAWHNLTQIFAAQLALPLSLSQSQSRPVSVSRGCKSCLCLGAAWRVAVDSWQHKIYMLSCLHAH